jgi:hypothetical protein
MNAPLRFPWGFSFRECGNYCATLQSVEAYNQRDPPAGASVTKILRKHGATSALRGSGERSGSDDKLPVECPPSASGLLFSLNCDKWRVLVSLLMSIWPYVYSELRWNDSKRQSHDKPPESYVHDCVQRCESDHIQCTGIWCTIQLRIFHPSHATWAFWSKRTIFP